MTEQTTPSNFLTQDDFMKALGKDTGSFTPKLCQAWQDAQSLWDTTKELMEYRDKFQFHLKVQTQQLDRVARHADAAKILEMLQNRSRDIGASAGDFAVMYYPDLKSGRNPEFPDLPDYTDFEERQYRDCDAGSSYVEIEDENEENSDDESDEESDEESDGESEKDEEEVKDIKGTDEAEDVKEKSKAEDMKENDQDKEKVGTAATKGEDKAADVKEKPEVEDVEHGNKAEDVEAHDKAKEVDEKDESIEASKAGKEQKVDSDQPKTSASTDAVDKDWECKTCQTKRKVREKEESDGIDKSARNILVSNKRGALVMARVKQLEAEADYDASTPSFDDLTEEQAKGIDQSARNIVVSNKRSVLVMARVKQLEAEEERIESQGNLTDHITPEVKPDEAAPETTKPEQDAGGPGEKIPAAEPQETTQSDSVATARPKTKVESKQKETSLANGKDPHDAWYRLHNDIFALHRAMIQVNSEGYLARYTLPALPSYPTDRLPTTFVVEDAAGASSTAPKQG